jgi:Phage portal protein
VGRRIDILKHTWSVFVQGVEAERDPQTFQDLGPASSYRPERQRFQFATGKTIIAAIYTRMSIDAAAVPIRHVRLDKNDQYQTDIDSNLNNCLEIEANIDQGARHFRQDLVQSLFDWGVAAILPIETTLNPLETGGYDVNTMRVGQILQWYPNHVRIRAYNQLSGIREEVTVPKGMVAIVENPLYSVINEPNSTLQRLLRKLHLLDAVDEQSASGKLDIIIQLPYVIKTESRREEARKRLKEIEVQLAGSQHGIAYTDGTEKIVQLNRPAENNLMGQIDYLTTMLYGQLGITAEVMNGTAGPDAMVVYFNRTIEPILAAITEAMARSFLTRTARTQGQAIMSFNNLFKLIPIEKLAEIADKFTRNEILSSNEFRAILGIRPSSDPKADELRNSNLRQADEGVGTPAKIKPNGTAVQQPAIPVTPFKAIEAPQKQGVNSQNGS